MSYTKTDYREFKQWLELVPVIESHEHYHGVTQPYSDIFPLIVDNYLDTDMLVANGGTPPLKTINSCESFEDKCQSFLSIFKNTQYTCYAQAARNAFLMCYDADILTMDGLYKIRDMQPQRNQQFHDKLIEKAGIKAAICDLFMNDAIDYTDDKYYADWCRFAIGTPRWHNITCYADVKNMSEKNFKGAKITSLDDYVTALDSCTDRYMQDGRVYAMKDQSAYTRDIEYKNPSKEQAENIFNKLVSNEYCILSEEDARVLDDYLFHRIVGLCAKYKIPMQIHTGHLADGYNNVRGANAANLTELISLHPDTTFDLFHGNYPYMGDFLFLGKNYPNVMLNLCWLHSIDTDYSIELMRRMVLTCPTTKVLAFGGDTFKVETQVAYLDQARVCVSKALCSLIDDELLDMDAAKRIAADWLYNNPNRIYKLGFEPYSV